MSAQYKEDTPLSIRDDITPGDLRGVSGVTVRLMSVSRAAAARGAAGFGSAKIDDRSSGAAARAPSVSSVSVVEGLSDRRSDRPDLETSWSPPRCTRDRALTGGEAAPLDQPWRASHRSGHDDAKALLQAHRHVISRGSRRTGDAELFAGGQDAQQIFLYVWMAGLAPQSHRHRHVPGACPDGADAPHLTQNVANVLHPLCFFDDAHQ